MDVYSKYHAHFDTEMDVYIYELSTWNFQQTENELSHSSAACNIPESSGIECGFL